MDAVIDACMARLVSQLDQKLIREAHDDEPTEIRQTPSAFLAPQGMSVVQLTVGSPGKIIVRTQINVYYCVPLDDRRKGMRKLAAIAPFVLADWLGHRRLGGVARDMQVGQAQGQSEIVNVPVAGDEYRAMMVPLVIETETPWAMLLDESGQPLLGH